MKKSNAPPQRKLGRATFQVSAAVLNQYLPVKERNLIWQAEGF
jgi:hypothetical protein